jgi:hypothetical protein
MQWFMLFLVEAVLLFLAAVPVAAAAIIHLFGKRWRRAISAFAGILSVPLILMAGVSMPSSVRFLASQPYYLGEIARAPKVDGVSPRLEWLIRPASDGQDVSVIYDQTGGGGSGSQGRLCAEHIKPIRGGFFMKSVVCTWE